MPDNDVLLTLVSELEGFKLSSGNGTSAEGVKNHNRMMMLSARRKIPNGPEIRPSKPSLLIALTNRTARRYHPYEINLRKSSVHLNSNRLRLKMSCSWCHFAAVQNGQSAKTVAGYDVKRLSSLAGLLDRSDFDGILPMRMLPMRRNPSDPLLLDRFGQTSCATQARQVEENDSLTVNELAGYFDDFLYLPKSMSIMAEGMYA